jgi:hypothetical protein
MIRPFENCDFDETWTGKSSTESRTPRFAIESVICFFSAGLPLWMNLTSLCLSSQSRPLSILPLCDLNWPFTNPPLWCQFLLRTIPTFASNDPARRG